MSEKLECNFVIYELAEKQVNVFRCTRCGRFVRVLGDREPPKKICLAPEGALAKPTIKQILLDAVDKISEKYQGVYLIWFGTKGHYFASWSHNSGFKFDSNARTAEELFGVPTPTDHTERVYKIPYTVGFGERQSEDSEYVATV